MNADPVALGVQQILLEQVAKTMLETSGEKDSPFAALLTTVLAGQAKP